MITKISVPYAWAIFHDQNIFNWSTTSSDEDIKLLSGWDENTEQLPNAEWLWRLVWKKLSKSSSLSEFSLIDCITTQAETWFR